MAVSIPASPHAAQAFYHDHFAQPQALKIGMCTDRLEKPNMINRIQPAVTERSDAAIRPPR